MKKSNLTLRLAQAVVALWLVTGAGLGAGVARAQTAPAAGAQVYWKAQDGTPIVRDQSGTERRLLLANPPGDQAIIGNGLFSVEGRFRAAVLNGIFVLDGSRFPTLQDALDAQADVNQGNGGVTYVPANAGTPYALSQPLRLDKKGSNWTLEGTGLYSSALTLASGANSSMLVTGDRPHVRTGIIGLWFNGNRDRQSDPRDCLVFGDRDQWWGTTFDRGGVASCSGSGARLGSRSYTTFGNQGLHLYTRSIFTDNGGSGLEIVPPVMSFSSVGNVYQRNDREGVDLHLTDDVAGVTNVVSTGYRSFGDWFEGNRGYALRADGWRGVLLVSPYLNGPNQILLGRQTRDSAILRPLARNAALYDAGFYNEIERPSCEQSGSGAQLSGACPNRGKFPVKEEHYDPSAVADWDMSARGTDNWQPDRAAVVSKTEYLSATTGNRYLRVTCRAAPCEVTQGVPDTLAGSAYFTALYSASDNGAVVGFQIRGAGNQVLADSGWLSAAQNEAVRPEYKWDTTAWLTGGHLWRIVLRCNSTTVACLFTDLRLVRNYVANGGFEAGLDGWSEEGSGCASSSRQAFTGTRSAHGTETCELYQEPQLMPGEYYLVQGWVYSEGAAGPAFGWGRIRGGKEDGQFRNFQFFDTTRADGEWEFIQVVVRADGTNDRVDFARLLGKRGMDAYLDDVAVLHLRRNPQFEKNYVEDLVLGGESLTAVPRSVYATFLPGPLNTAWVGSTLAPDRRLLVTRLQVQVKTPPEGCRATAVVRVSDGATALDVQVKGPANDSGPVAVDYAAGAPVTVSVVEPAQGCRVTPAEANVLVQYRTQ